MTNPALALPDLPPPTLLELPESLLRSANQPLGVAIAKEEPLHPRSEPLLGLLAVLTAVSGLWWGLLMLTVSAP